MWSKVALAALVAATVSMMPSAFAQNGIDALDSTADTGQMGGFDNGPTEGNFNGGSGSTGNQNLGLPEVASGAPLMRGGPAPGNLALKQLGKKTLPPTRLTGFVKRGGDAVFGGDRELLPEYFTFQQFNRIEQSMQQMPDLTTKHRINSPSAWDFPR